MANVFSANRTLKNSMGNLFGEEAVSAPEERTKQSSLDVRDIEIEKIRDFHDHLFQKYQKERMDELIQSIREQGILNPVILNEIIENEDYEILAGHNRCHAGAAIGLKTVPAIIKKNLTEHEAMLIVTQSNLIQRSFAEMLPSEKAKVLKQHYIALKNVREEFAEEIQKEMEFMEAGEDQKQEKGIRSLEGNYDLSKSTIARYLRLAELTDELLEYVDQNKIKMQAGVELSYLDEETQIMIWEVCENEEIKKIDLEKAEILRRMPAADIDSIREILLGNVKKKKNPGRPKKYGIRGEIITKYFNDSTRKDEIENVIEKALQEYFERRDNANA